MNPRNLPTDLKITERTLKQMKAAEPEPVVPETEDYYQRLHDKIMAQVEQKEIKPPPPPINKTKELLKRHWRNGLYLVTMSALAAVISVKTVNSVNSQVNGNHAVAKFSNEDQLVGLLKDSPDVMNNTVLSSFNSQDMLSDGAYSNLDLTKEFIDSM
jgi:hypothetical protein